MKDDLNQEYTQFKIVADMKCKEAKSEHDKHMIMWRLEQLRQRYVEYSEKGWDIDKVREVEKKLLQSLQALSQAILARQPQG